MQSRDPVLRDKAANYLDLDVSRLERRKPDTLAEPPAWDVSVRR